MKNTTDYAAAAQKNETHALAVIRKSGIIPAWKNIGAEINLVGSLKIGTLGKHPDIDFHTYTPELDIIGTGQVILYTGLFRNIPTIPPRFSTIFARTVSKPSLIIKTQNDETGKCRGAKPRCSETDRNA